MAKIKIKMKREEAREMIRSLRQSKEVLYHDNDLLRYVDYAIYRIAQYTLLKYKGSVFPPQGFGSSVSTSVSVVASSSGSGSFFAKQMALIFVAGGGGGLSLIHI